MCQEKIPLRMQLTEATSVDIPIAITQALHESQLCTITALRNYICKHNLNKDDFMKIIDDFQETIKKTGVYTKRKKEPSMFNLYIRDKINEFKVLHPESNGHDLMRMAISSWKSRRHHATQEKMSR